MSDILISHAYYTAKAVSQPNKTPNVQLFKIASQLKLENIEMI